MEMILTYWIILHTENNINRFADVPEKPKAQNRMALLEYG